MDVNQGEHSCGSPFSAGWPYEVPFSA